MPELPSLLDALTELAQVTSAADVPCKVGPADLEIPGAFVALSLVDFDTLSAGEDSYEMTADMLLVAGAAGDTSALQQLDRMLWIVRGLWNVTEARAVSIALPNHSPDPLPALQCSLTVSVTPSPTP